jgi:hypothetical protein
VKAYFGMALRSALNLSDEDKLEVLQRLDQFRLWHSLDEKRYCLVCGKIITGQEVRVTGGENGPLRVSCPTEHCNAIPMKWVRPTDEVLIKIAKLQAANRDVAAPQGHRPARENSVVSRVSKSVVQFKATEGPNLEGGIA